jgi:hypothetical protein
MPDLAIGPGHRPCPTGIGHLTQNGPVLLADQFHIVPDMAAASRLDGAAQLAPDPSVLTVGIGVFAVLQLATGIFLTVAPHAFYKYVGPYGTLNVHYLRDLATFYIADGIALAVAVQRVHWRVPVLFLTMVQFALHSVNHLIDIDKAHPAWNGYFDFFSLTAGALLLVWLWRRAVAEAQA